ncbi:MAG: hypothetical protein NC341_07170 [Blautia sp.]|nr:hypothetical protein [Blautia sp.]MCM1199754.1 hypothetical protein [Bacteroides fragilis]
MKNLQIRKISCKEAAGWLFLGAGAVMLMNSVRLCFCGDIWYDELFTVGMAEHSYGEFIRFTAKDVHPPLYYAIVKTVLDLCKLIFPAADSVIVIKLVSVLPYFFLLAYGLFFLRKKFGMFVAGLFFFSVLSMPQMSAYTVEMRMYGWALFFVTTAFFHAYGIVCGDGAGRRIVRRFRLRGTEYFLTFRGNGHFAALAFYGLAAAYTQYFACVAVVMVYAYLFVWFLVRYKRSGGQDKNAGRALQSWFVCAAVSVLAYVPWLSVIISQVAAVSENYWILPLTWRSLGGCVKFLMKPAFSHEWLNVTLAAVLSSVYAGLLVCYGFRVWKGREAAGPSTEEADGEDKAGGADERRTFRFFYALAGCLVLGGLTAFGFIASILIRPVFVYRYMLPAMGCFWFCPILCLDGLLCEAGPREGKKPEERRPGMRFKRALFLAAALFAAVGIRDYRAFWGEERYKAVLMEETELVISDIAKEDIILYNFDQLQAVAGYYLEQENYLWMGEPEPLVIEIFGNKGSVGSTEQIREWLEEGRTVWFFGSFNSREDVRKAWAEDGILTEEKGSCMLERYWFNLYSVFQE